MMNKEILDQIYNAVNAEDKADNPFETLQTDTPYEAFYKEYIKPLEKKTLNGAMICGLLSVKPYVPKGNKPLRLDITPQ